MRWIELSRAEQKGKLQQCQFRFHINKLTISHAETNNNIKLRTKRNDDNNNNSSNYTSNRPWSKRSECVSVVHWFNIDMSVLIRAQALPLSFSSSILFSYMFVHSFFLSLCVVNFIFGWLSAWVAAIVSEIWHKFLMIWILSTVVWALVGRASHGIHNMHIYIFFSFPFHCKWLFQGTAERSSGAAVIQSISIVHQTISPQQTVHGVHYIFRLS